jgi:hypothetical protein
MMREKELELTSISLKKGKSDEESYDETPDE